MTAFKEYLQEFRSNVPLGNSLPKSFFEEKFDESEILKLQIVIPNEKNISIYEYNGFGHADKFIILVDRVKKEKDIVGYAWLNNKVSDGKYWQVRDVFIYDPYKRKGVGYNLYVKLIKNGFNLINGYSLSTEIEKVWRKLQKDVNVNTVNIKTNQISKFDERPKEDKGEDDTQIYFWLASSNQLIKEEEDNNCPHTIHWYKLWLAGSTTTPGGFRSNNYSDPLDF